MAPSDLPSRSRFCPRSDWASLLAGLSFTKPSSNWMDFSVSPRFLVVSASKNVGVPGGI
jgi:hypothetical protein